MDHPLSDVEVRVLGALIEKERTTPDGYPLSLNALTAACNQASNREPVMSLDEPTVSAAVHALRQRSLVRAHIHSGGRVTKYGQLMGETMGLVNRQLAVLCVLMLRGPQTVGELRTRTQRLHPFESIEEVESTLDGLAGREPAALVVRLPRRPGQKEERWAQLLAGDAVVAAWAAGTGDPSDDDDARPRTRPTPIDDGRLERLEHEVASLREELTALREELAGFRRQFE